MSKNMKVLGLVVALFCLVAFGLSGCAKQQVVKEETIVAEEIAPAEEATAKAEEQEALLK